jgi:NTE family protein
VPFQRKGTPETLTEIINRLDEISFNTSLLSELRTIELMQKLVEEGHLKSQNGTRFKSMNIHIIQDEVQMTALGATSKINTELDFLLHLKEMGRSAADRWLKENGASIGVRSSVDLRSLVFLESGESAAQIKQG